MKIGFDVGGETDKEESKSGFADASSKNEDYDFSDWVFQILLDFTIGYGVCSFIRDVINQLRRRPY